MSDGNVCVAGGLVVGTKFEIPGDVRVYRRDKSELIGCNRLFCSDCKTWVKFINGFYLSGAGQDRAVDHRALYDSENADDWEEYLAPGDQFRTYFCRCSWVSWSGLQAAGALDSKNIDGWRCGGHPE